MLQQPVERSASLGEACERFLDQVGAWVDTCLRRYEDLPPTRVHDQGTFTTGWEPYLRARPHGWALAVLKTMRNRIRARFEGTGEWRHGYWRKQEAHHGTEHFEIFLGALWRLDPADPETARQIADAAEHAGNRVPGVPAWFDWDTGLFRSAFLGTEHVGAEGLNVPDHFRLVNLSLLAHDATGEGSYLDVARAAATRWAEAIRADPDALPVAIDSSGPVYDASSSRTDAYTFAGAAPPLEESVGRAENIVASDGHGALLRLAERTGEPGFREAAERVLDVAATQLHDPDAGTAAGALRFYRRVTGEARYDAALRAAAAALEPAAVANLELDPGAEPFPPRTGFGKRKDQPVWREDGAVRRHNPITLAAAAEAAADPELAREAVDLARTQFVLARRAWPRRDGREHGCAARSVSAIARGHGRENHTGTVTGVLGPVLERPLAGAAA